MKKNFFIFLALILLIGCSNNEKNKDLDISENKNIIEIDVNEDNKKKEKDVKTINESSSKDLVFENLYFDDKDIDFCLDFFKKYNIEFEISDSYIKNWIVDENNDLHNGDDYGYDWTPQTPYLGTYIYNDRLNLLTTSLENNKSDLQVYTKSLDEDVKITRLIENINYLEPLYTYDYDKLYYSSDTVDGKSILGVFSLDNYKNEYLLENQLKLDGDQCTGDVITLVSKLGGDIICQSSHYNKQSIRDDKPISNKLIYLDDNSKEIDLGKNNFDLIEKVDNYIICHDRGYGDEDRLVKIYDEDFNLLYKSSLPIDRLIAVSKLVKNDKIYILLSDSLWTHYIIDVEDNEENYQLNGLNNIERNFGYSKDKFIISSDDITYIGKAVE